MAAAFGKCHAAAAMPMGFVLQLFGACCCAYFNIDSSSDCGSEAVSLRDCSE